MLCSKALEINLFYPKKADGQVFRGAGVQKSTRQFSDGLDLPERIYNSHYGNGVPAMFTS